MRLALLLAGLISFAPAGAWAQQAPETPDATDADSSPKAASTDSKAVPLDEIRRFVTVFNSIRQAYVTPKSDTELMHSAVRGLLFDLDPHSVYFDRDDAEREWLPSMGREKPVQKRAQAIARIGKEEIQEGEGNQRAGKR